jgi:hypothetical protein
MSERRMCRHCGAEVACRPRGLGWKCFYTPGVKDLYPPTSKYARRGTRNFYGPAPLPERTDTLPGTKERLKVFEDRAARGLALFHPDDPAVIPCQPKRVTVRVCRAAAGSAVFSRDVLAGCGIYREMGDFR